MLRLTMVGLALVFGVACGSGSTTDDDGTGDTTGGSEATGGAHGICVTAMTRERECQAEFLPALVELRVRLDMPAGIAERAEAEGQEAILEEAREEYVNDATDEAIEANCSQLDEMPEDRTQPIIDTETRCLEAEGCAAFVECQIAFHEARFTGR